VTRDDVLSKLGRRAPVEVAGVLVRPWTAAERLDFLAWNRANKGGDVYAQLVARSVCDAAGALLLAPADVDALDGAAVEEIGDRAIGLNRLGANAPKAG
jgi:hypothetical protein